MQQSESQAEPICRACRFENDLACELGDDISCKQCGASLCHEVLVTYEDVCPLCKVSFDDGKPHVIGPSSASVRRWLCQDCWSTPRGESYQAFHSHSSGAEPEPPCELCGARSTLLPLTHSHPDGRPLCTSCAETETGRQWVKEHYEDSWPDPAEKERLAHVRQLLETNGVPFVEDADHILVARSDAPLFVRLIFAHAWRFEVLDGLTLSSDGALRAQVEHSAWWTEPEVPTESGVLATIDSHPPEVTHYEFFVDVR